LFRAEISLLKICSKMMYNIYIYLLNHLLFALTHQDIYKYSSLSYTTPIQENGHTKHASIFFTCILISPPRTKSTEHVREAIAIHPVSKTHLENSGLEARSFSFFLTSRIELCILNMYVCFLGEEFYTFRGKATLQNISKTFKIKTKNGIILQVKNIKSSDKRQFNSTCALLFPSTRYMYNVYTFADQNGPSNKLRKVRK